MSGKWMDPQSSTHHYLLFSAAGDGAGSGLTIGPNAWLKRKLHLRPQHRGVHLVTEEILAGLPELHQFQVRQTVCRYSVNSV